MNNTPSVSPYLYVLYIKEKKKSIKYLYFFDLYTASVAFNQYCGTDVESLYVYKLTVDANPEYAILSYNSFNK